jgi:hypothetical protein
MPHAGRELIFALCRQLMRAETNRELAMSLWRNNICARGKCTKRSADSGMRAISWPVIAIDLCSRKLGA